VQIPPHERDPRLKDKLWERERRAILRWCIDGSLEWYRTGLNPPKIVTDTTSEYFEEQDIVGQWIEESINPQPGEFAFTLSSTLFASWKAWCEPKNLKPGTEKAFAEALKDRGFQTARKHAGRGFGIALKGA
jgi:putative DNA primase/helicase